MLLERYFNYVILLDKNNHTLLIQRSTDDIWKKLYQFPLVEKVNATITTQEIIDFITSLGFSVDKTAVKKYNNNPLTHKLSHQHLITTFWVVHLQTEIKNGIKTNQLKKYPVPILIAKVIEELNF